MKPNRARKINRCLNFKMPWGKFKMKRLDDIPSSYLKWLAENCDQDDISTAADLVYEYREEVGDHK